MKIAVFSAQSYDQEFLELYNTGHQLAFFEVPLNLDTLSLVEGFDGLCLFVNDRADRQVLAILQQKGIGLLLLRCAGFNNVDLSSAMEFGIRVLRVPAYSPQAVAEHAMAMILTLNRKTHKAYNRVKEGNFSLQGLMGFNLHSCRVALIGTGQIGKAFYNILEGFGCKVVAYDPFPDQELVARGLEYLSLADALSGAKIVSLHCPLTSDNHHLINSASLRLLSTGAMLINTSRGGLVSAEDVIKGLKSGQLGSLGLDVYEQESTLFFHDRSSDIIQDDLITRLISFPNVLITSHQGFFTKEAMQEIATTTFVNIDAFASGAVLENQVLAEKGFD